jgi:hypothetical protein
LCKLATNLSSVIYQYDYDMNENPEINLAWNVIRSLLQNEFSFYDIKEIVGLSGLDLSNLAHLVQKAGGGASKGQLMTEIDKCFFRLPISEKNIFISYVIEELLNRRPNFKEKLEKYLTRYLTRFGWGLVGTSLIPLSIFDPLELEQVSKKPRHELIKAAERLRNGDLSGAVTAACGAVEICTEAVYEKYRLGNPREASFQERCKRALDAIRIAYVLEEQLQNMGWKQEQIKLLVNNFQGSLNQGAYVMQSLRPTWATSTEQNQFSSLWSWIA